MRVYVHALADDEIVSLGAVLVTSRARTLVDCTRHLLPHDALALADAALRRGEVTHAALAGALARAARTPGVEQARRVIALADGRRETTLESWSAWAFAVHKLPSPRWQTTLCDHEGVFIGRVDAWWPEGVVGEADGRVKYRLASLQRRGIVDAEGLGGALDDERRRERGLQRAGALMVRWEPRDVLDPPLTRALAGHLRGQLGVAHDAAAFTGKVIDI